MSLNFTRSCSHLFLSPPNSPAPTTLPRNILSLTFLVAGKGPCIAETLRYPLQNHRNLREDHCQAHHEAASFQGSQKTIQRHRRNPWQKLEQSVMALLGPISYPPSHAASTLQGLQMPIYCKYIEMKTYFVLSRTRADFSDMGLLTVCLSRSNESSRHNIIFCPVFKVYEAIFLNCALYYIVRKKLVS